MARTVKEVGPPSPPTVVVKAPPPPTTRSAPALNLTPKQRQAFHRWIIGVWFARYLDGLLAGVVSCVKDHESGDYAEHSHPWEGSGAYQYVPTTWRHWSALAGFGGYELAYEAPAVVQDAVFLFTIRHGGAGNWSDRFGFDPCTAGL